MSSFIDAFREARNSAKQDKEDTESFNKTMNSLAEKYAESRNISKEDALNKITGLVKKAGEYDGTLNADSSEGDIARYGSKLFSDMGYEDMEMGFNDYIKKYGTKDQQKAFSELEKASTSREQNNRKAQELALPIGTALGLAMAGGAGLLGGAGATSKIAGLLPSGTESAMTKAAGAAANTLSGGAYAKGATAAANAARGAAIADQMTGLGASGLGAGTLLGQLVRQGYAKKDAKNAKTLDDAYGTYEEAVKLANDDFFDILDNSEDIVSKMAAKKGTGTGSGNGDESESLSPISAAGKVGQAANNVANSLVNGGDTVTFTLPRANDPNYRGFGAKLQELGLTTDKGLWGSGGDVEFYTKQLYDQGALDSRGNLKIGVPITLRRRK